MSSLFNVWLVSWKHRWRFWFFWITLFERFYTLTQLVLILYCHITHAISVSDKISSKSQVFKIVQKFCDGRNCLYFTKFLYIVTVTSSPVWLKEFFVSHGCFPLGPPSLGNHWKQWEWGSLSHISPALAVQVHILIAVPGTSAPLA